MPKRKSDTIEPKHAWMRWGLFRDDEQEEPYIIEDTPEECVRTALDWFDSGTLYLVRRLKVTVEPGQYKFGVPKRVP